MNNPEIILFLTIIFSYFTGSIFVLKKEASDSIADFWPSFVYLILIIRLHQIKNQNITMADDQESTVSAVGDIGLGGDHANELHSETIIFQPEGISPSLSSAGTILPQDLISIQSLDSNHTSPSFSVSSNAGKINSYNYWLLN